MENKYYIANGVGITDFGFILVGTGKEAEAGYVSVCDELSNCGAVYEEDKVALVEISKEDYETMYSLQTAYAEEDEEYFELEKKRKNLLTKLLGSWY